jgi:ankyrin repeat protein
MSENKITETIRRLFKSNDKNDKEEFIKAVKDSDIKKLHNLLTKKPNLIKTEDIIGLAATTSSKEILDILLSYGGDINKKNTQDLTPLHQAIQKQNEEMVKAILLHTEFNLEKNNKNDTALEFAILSGNINIINMLIEKGAKINEKNIEKLFQLTENNPDINNNLFKNIVKILVKELGKETSNLLHKKQNLTEEQLRKENETVKIIYEEIDKITNKKAEIISDQDLLTAEKNMLEGIKAIKEGNPEKAEQHFHKAEMSYNEKGDKQGSDIAKNLKDALGKATSKEIVGPHTEQLAKERSNNGHGISL